MQKKAGQPAKRWILYVLRCQDSTLYCGITNNLPGRFETHNRGKGTRYTKGRGPVVLMKSWPAAGMGVATRSRTSRGVVIAEAVS